jgi:hypothetical protein
MTLATQITTDDAVFFNPADFALAAKYNSKDGTVVSAAVTVILDLDADLGGAAYGQANMASIWLKTADVARPAVYDEITIGATVYTVRARGSGAHGVVQVYADTDQRQNGGIA